MRIHGGPEHSALQEAGYIDARPQADSSTNGRTIRLGRTSVPVLRGRNDCNRRKPSTLMHRNEKPFPNREPTSCREGARLSQDVHNVTNLVDFNVLVQGVMAVVSERQLMTPADAAPSWLRIFAARLSSRSRRRQSGARNEPAASHIPCAGAGVFFSDPCERLRESEAHNSVTTR
jgi:hypothetical protein